MGTIVPGAPFVAPSPVYSDSNYGISPSRALNRHNSVWKKVSKKLFGPNFFSALLFAFASPHYTQHYTSTVVWRGILFIPDLTLVPATLLLCFTIPLCIRCHFWPTQTQMDASGSECGRGMKERGIEKGSFLSLPFRRRLLLAIASLRCVFIFVGQICRNRSQ